MSGICVAVNATTSYAGSSRNATLKSWKSRPAAPRTTTRRGAGPGAGRDPSVAAGLGARGPVVLMANSAAEVDRRNRHTLERVVLAAGPATPMVAPGPRRVRRTRPVSPPLRRGVRHDRLTPGPDGATIEG